MNNELQNSFINIYLIIIQHGINFTNEIKTLHTVCWCVCVLTHPHINIHRHTHTISYAQWPLVKAKVEIKVGSETSGGTE